MAETKKKSQGPVRHLQELKDDEHYTDWEERMEAHLMMKGLVQHIKNENYIEEKRNDLQNRRINRKEFQEELLKDQKAIGIIRSYVSPHNNNVWELAQCETAAEVWKKIEVECTRASNPNRQKLINKFQALAQGKNSIRNYAERKQSLRKKLEKMDYHMTDRDFLGNFLSNAHPRLHVQIQQLMHKDLDNYDIKKAIKRLQDAEDNITNLKINMQRNNIQPKERAFIVTDFFESSEHEKTSDMSLEDAVHETAFTAQSNSENQRNSSNRKQVKTCYHCNRPGHFIKDCETLKRDRKRAHEETKRFLANKRSKKQVSFALEDCNETNSCQQSDCNDSSGSEVTFEHSMLAENNMNDLDDNVIYLDSGSTIHMTGRKELFSFMKPYTKKSITTANNTVMQSHSVGTITVEIPDKDAKNQKLTLRNVLYVPDLGHKCILSLWKLVQNGFVWNVQKKSTTMLIRNNITIPVHSQRNLFLIYYQQHPTADRIHQANLGITKEI